MRSFTMKRKRPVSENRFEMASFHALPSCGLRVTPLNSMPSEGIEV